MNDHLIHLHRLPGGGAPHEAGFVGTPSGGPGLTRFRGAGFLLHRRVPSEAGSYLGSTGPSATAGEPSELLAVPVAHRGVLLATRRPTAGDPLAARGRHGQVIVRSDPGPSPAPAKASPGPEDGGRGPATSVCRAALGGGARRPTLPRPARSRSGTARPRRSGPDAAAPGTGAVHEDREAAVACPRRHRTAPDGRGRRRRPRPSSMAPATARSGGPTSPVSGFRGASAMGVGSRVTAAGLGGREAPPARAVVTFPCHARHDLGASRAFSGPGRGRPSHGRGRWRTGDRAPTEIRMVPPGPLASGPVPPPRARRRPTPTRPGTPAPPEP